MIETRSSWRAVLEEHQHVRGLMELAGSTQRAMELGVVLARLRARLIDHFAREEGAAELRDLLLSRAPHRLEQLEHAFAQHRRILADLGRLEVQVADLVRRRRSVAIPKALLHSVGTWLRSVREHEESETELIAEAVRTDRGAGD